MKVFHGVALAAATALMTVGLAAPPALAAAPSNDVSSGAEVITALPFSTTLDTTEATTDADDVELNLCGAPAFDATVWYRFTAAADEEYTADASASDYSAGVFVATGAPGALTMLECGSGVVAWPAAAGETYWVVVFDDQEDGGGNGGSMSLVVDVAPPRPALEVAVDPIGRIDARTGTATISGTLLCGEDAGAAYLETQLTQRAGRLLIRGWNQIDVPCDGTAQPWSMVVSGENGIFKAGKAASVTFSFACVLDVCSDDFAEHTIQLKGKR